MLPALLLNATSTMVQPFASTPLAFAAIVGTGALGSAVSMPSISPLYLDHVDAEERATALAMRQMAQDVGTLVGASSMGAMALAHGIPSAMVAVATMQGAAALFFALRVPRTPVRGPNRRPVSKE